MTHSIPRLTPAIIDRFGLAAERVDHWRQTSAAERRTAYDHGLFEIRSCTAQERGAGGRIVGGHRGPGAALAIAVDYAWQRAENGRIRQARINREQQVRTPDHDEYMVRWHARRPVTPYTIPAANAVLPVFRD